MKSYNFSASEEKPETPTNNSNKAPLLTVESIDNHVYFYADVNTDRLMVRLETKKYLGQFQIMKIFRFGFIFNPMGDHFSPVYL